MEFKLIVLAAVILAATVAEGRYFRIDRRGINFHTAKRLCRARRAHLAYITNPRQNRQVLRLLRGKRTGSQLYWIGLNDIRRERRWVWNNGRRMRWNYFAPGEPNNAGGNQDCAAANWHRSRRWDDRNCGDRLAGAICQTGRRRPKRCPKTRIIRGRCARNGLRAERHIYYARTRRGRCRRKVFVKRVRCGSGHKNFCRCSAVGDPHYRTFDGNLIHFYGVCKYTLAQSLRGGACSFKIEVKNERRGRNRRVSYTRYVEVKMGGVSYRLGQRRRVYINGAISSVPIRKGKVRVFYSGRNVQFVHATCGVRVAFDGKSNAYLQISGRFRGKMNGICGNCNGNRADDMTTKGGRRVSGHRGYNLIGDSYAVKDDSPGPNRCKSKVVTRPQPKRWCKGRMARLIGKNKFCGGLRDRRGPFSKCFRIARLNPDDLFRSCKIDVCANDKDPRQQHKSKCEAFKALEERCNEKEVTGINWRSRYGCPLTCGTNKEYSTSMNPCPKTCENHFLGTETLCYKLPKREGCQCKKGFLRDGALCVKPAQCKCLEFCMDRSKHCGRWKKSNRCYRFPRTMRRICALTCGFCKKKPRICEDHISTRRCMKFRRQGKCRYAFFAKICGLTCNLKGCPCKKGRKINGPCRKNKTRRVTVIRYVRSKRTHRCKLYKRVRVVSCGRCRTFKRTKLSRCNLCKRRRILTTVRQRRIRKACVKRVTKRSIRCGGCSRRARTYRRCVRNRYRLITTTFNVRVGCFRCVRRRRRRRITIRCGRKVTTVSRCNRVTRRKIITVRTPFVRGCRCYRRTRRYRVVCACRGPKKRNYCYRGRRVFVYVRWVLRGRRCIRIRRVRRVRIKCPRNTRKAGPCIRGPCHRIITSRRYYVNGACKCSVIVRRKAQRCCCRPGFTSKRCLRRLGIIQVNKVTFILRYNRRLRRRVCIRRVRTTRRVMRCGRRRVLLRRTACRRPKCIQYYTYLLNHRRGCKCYRRRVTRPRRCCCRRPSSRTRCVRHKSRVRTTYIWTLVGQRCRLSVRRRVVRRVVCRRRRVIKRPCNKRTRRQTIIYVRYYAFRCRCRRRTIRRSRLCYCGPSSKKLYRCNRKTCRQTFVVITRRGPVRGRCIIRRRVRRLRCCCRRNYVRRYCNRRIGYHQILTYRYIFVRRTRSCLLRKSVRTIVRRCRRSSVRRFKCRRCWRKIVISRSYRIRRLCRCKNTVRVIRKRCCCPRPKWLPTICSRGRLVRRQRVYRLRGNRCPSYIKRYYRRIKCRRNRRVRNGKCSRSCRRVVNVTYTVRVRCKCVRRRRRYIRLCCCRNSKGKTCRRGNRSVTTIIKRRLNRRKTRCVPRVIRKVRMIRCKRRQTVRRGRCNRRNCRRRYLYTRFAVRHCRCVVVRRYVKYRVCCCRPAYRRTTRCYRNRYITTVRRLILVRNRCVARIRRYTRYIHCGRPKRRVSACNKRTRRRTIVYVFYRLINCKCRRYRRVKSEICRCPRPGYFKTRCRRNVRYIYRYYFALVRSRRGKKCRKLRRRVTKEPCRCPRLRRTNRCVGIGRRITTVYYRTTFVRVGRSRLTKRRCLRRVSSRFIRTRCTASRKVVYPCRRYRRVYKYFYSVVSRCRCYRRSRILKIRACNCNKRDSVRRRCWRGRFRQTIIRDYRPRGAVCVLKRIVKNSLVRCTRRVFVRKIRSCNLRIGITTYSVYLRTRYRVVNCRCRPFRRRYRRACRCPKNRYIRRCIGGVRVNYKITYRISRNRCFKIQRRTSSRIYCKPKTRVGRRGCSRSCYRKYRISYYVKRACKCVRRTRYYSQKCCCRRRGGRGPKPGRWVYRGCARGYKVYTNTRYILVATRRFRVRIRGRYYVRVMRCRRVRKTIKKRVVCRRNVRYYKRCNKKTGILYVTKRWTVKRGCRCLRLRRTRRYRCRCSPRRYYKKGPCKRGKYFRKVTIRWRVLRGRRCVWFRKSIRVRCRCLPRRRSKRCDGRGNMVTRIVTYRLVGRVCRVKIYKRSKPTRCGRASSKERVYIGKCKGGKRKVLFVRRVVNRRICRCVRKVRRRYFACPCKKDRLLVKRCIRNNFVIVIIRRWRRVGFRCIKRDIKLSKTIRCRRGRRVRLLRCNVRKNIRTAIIIMFGQTNCKCTKKVRRRVIPCACKPVNRLRRTCKNNNVIYTTYDRGFRRGLTCDYRKIVRTKTVRCYRRRYTRPLRCNRRTCRQPYVTTQLKPLNCKCKRVVVRRFTRICCCKLNRKVRRRCVRGAIVTTVSYTVRRGYRCIRVRRVTRRPIRCSRRRWSRRACKGCNGIRRYYTYKNIRCKCKPAVYYVKRVKCCCRKNYRVKRCLARRGVIVTTYYKFYLSRGRCYRRAKSYFKRIICRGLWKKVSKCRRNRRVVRLIVNARRACRCIRRVARKFVEPCRCPKRIIKKQSKCGRWFKYVRLYRKVYRRRRGRGYCATVYVSRYRERCRCPKPMKKTYCARHYIRVTVSTRYKLTRRRPKRCIKKRTVRKRPMGRCNLRPKLVNTKYGPCSKKTLMRRLIKVFIVARGCRCKKFLRPYYKRCRCPKGSRRTRCYRNRYITTVVRYITIRRRGKVSCIRKVRNYSRPVRCKRGRKWKYGRCFRPRRGLARRFITIFLYYTRSCRCRRRILRRLIAPCRCPRPKKRIVCTRFMKIVSIALYRLNKRKTKCNRRVITERRKIKCNVGVSTKNTKCRRNTYFKVTTRRFVKKCRCRYRRYRRRCDCKCRRTRVTKRCSRRYFFYITTTRYAKRRCRCRAYRRVRRVLPRCPKKRLGVFRSRCNIKRGRSVYYLRRIVRRVVNRRRCTCGVRVYKRRIVCRCGRGRDRITRRCVRNRLVVTVRTRLVVSRVRNRCVRRVVGRSNRYVRCRGPKNVYKCNKRTGRLTVIRYRSYVRKCKCRRIRRVQPYGRCRCNKNLVKVYDRCNKRNCRRYIRYYRLRLVGRRCVRYYRNQVLRCCCPKPRTRKWCSGGRGLWITQTVIFVLKNSRRCVVRRLIKKRKVRCARRTVVRKRCVSRRFLTIYIYKNRRTGCRCRLRLVRIRRGRCGCRGPRSRTVCYPRRRKSVTVTVFYRLVGIRCIRKSRRSVRRIGCPRGIKRSKGKCNKVTGKIWYYRTRFYVTRRCKCRKVVKRYLRDCICRPRVRKTRRCNPRNGVITTTIRIRLLSKRTKRCFYRVERRRRRVSCRPSVWRRVKRRNRCLPIGRFGIRYRLYKRMVRRGCRCVPQRYRKPCHCRCRGPKRLVRCSGGRRRIITTYSYRYNGCRCTRRRRVRVVSIRCRRNRRFVSRCRRCRQTVTRIYYRVRGCRCYKKTIRRRRVCCCRRGKVIRRCIAGRIKTKTVVTYRFVPYRCIRIVRRSRVVVRCPRPKRVRHTPCRGRKYVVTLVVHLRRRCRCVRIIRRVRRPCPCRRARRLIGGCNRRSCMRRFTYVSYRLVKFRCIRSKKVIIRRCCCHRKYRKRFVCRRNRRIREVSWVVRRGQTCVRKIRRTDITPSCRPRRTKRRICRGRRLTLIITTRRLVRCRCYVRRRRITGYCSCPPSRGIRRCTRGRFRLYIRISYRRVGIRCFKKVTRKKRPVVCRRPRTRRYGCNRRSCVKTTVHYFTYVRNCRCRTRRSVSRVACCCPPRRSTRPRTYSTCNVRTGVKTVVFVRYVFNNRIKRCVRKVIRESRKTRCSRRVRRYRGRCVIRRGGRRYQTLRIIYKRRIACKCVRIRRRLTQLCRCRRAKYGKRCVRGVVVRTKRTERLVIRRGRRYCRVYKRVVGRKMVGCRRVYYKRSRCRRGRFIYWKIYHKKVGCKCRKYVIKRSKSCRCGKPGTRVYCNRRRNILRKVTVYYLRICPRSRFGWLRCRCLRRYKRTSRRIRCAKPRVYVYKCKRGRRTIKTVFYRLLRCKCYRKVVVKRPRCKACYNIITVRRCRKMNRRRKVCVRSPLYRNHLCKKYCACRPCVKGPKRVRYYRRPRRGLKTDKRYGKKYLIRKVRVPYTRRGIRKCKKICANNKLCKSFEVIKPKRKRPSKPGRPKRKTCTCVLQTVTPRTIRRHEGRKYRGSKSPRRVLYIRYCRKACKKKKVYRKVGRCRCVRAAKVCYAIVRVTWEKANRRGKCVKRSSLLKASCKRPCVNLRPKKVCNRYTRRGGCRKRRIRAICSKNCMPRCRCPRSYRVFSPCKRVRRRYVTYLTVVKYRRRLKVCTVSIRRYTKPCKQCNAKTRKRIVIGRCMRNKRTVTTYTYYRAVRRGRQVCLRKTRRVRLNCRGCCPSVIVRITPCRGGRRVRTRIFWARIRNCCRRRVVRETFRCNRCPRDRRRRGPCRYGVRVEFRFWYARSATTGRCYRRKTIRVRSCRLRR